MPRESVKLEYGTAQELALRFATGRTIPTEWGGDRILYSLTDGRSLFVSPDVSARIDALQLEPGEFFSIGKFRDGRKIVWRVERAGSAPAAVSPAAVSVPGAPGTDGALALAPVVQMPAPPRSGGPVPYNIAFREVLQFVNRELEQANENWSDLTRADMVRTVLEIAARSGHITIWERAA